MSNYVLWVEIGSLYLHVRYGIMVVGWFELSGEGADMGDMYIRSNTDDLLMTCLVEKLE